MQHTWRPLWHRIASTLASKDELATFTKDGPQERSRLFQVAMYIQTFHVEPMRGNDNCTCLQMGGAASKPADIARLASSAVDFQPPLGPPNPVSLLLLHPVINGSAGVLLEFSAYRPSYSAPMARRAP